MAVGDFDEDSHPDVAVAAAGQRGVQTLLTGPGGLRCVGAGRCLYPTGDQPASVAVGDFNRDRHQDLAVANRGSNNVSVLLGAGNGSFSAPFNFPAGQSPASVAVGDFNADSQPDLAVANARSDNVSVLLNNTTTCGGRTATVVGSPGADRLVGTRGSDVIVGGPGNDRIQGAAATT